MSYRIDFNTMEWETPMDGVRHKVLRRGSRILRLVEYSRTMPLHWCSRGHIGHIMEGEMRIEFESGTETVRAGDALFIPDGAAHAHRAEPMTPVVTALFVEEA